MNQSQEPDTCKLLKQAVRTVPDRPIAGVQFRDITPLLQLFTPVSFSGH